MPSARTMHPETRNPQPNAMNPPTQPPSERVQIAFFAPLVCPAVLPIHRTAAFEGNGQMIHT